ncbi:MAG TPA: lipid-binding SYLF domain-containing protein [Elainellaceae cyanobacterium]|jgi:lipid-binding SYLF domain-containing protein
MLPKRAIAIASTFFLVIGTGAPVFADVAEEQEEAIEEIEESREVFEEISVDSETRIPPALLRDSVGIIILTNVGQGGFIFGGRSGDGLMMVRQDDGTWSNPAFVTFGGGSFGLQVGGRSSDIVMLVQSQDTVNDILDGAVEFGGSVTGTAGPVGETAVDPAESSDNDILTYSRSSGFFGGVAVEGGTLSFDEDRNEAFYNVVNVTPEQILIDSTLLPAASADALEQALLAAE